MKKRFMEEALKEAYRGIARGDGGPFGACIIKGNRILAKAHNTVLKDKDSTCHAEITAIRRACAKLKTYDLSGAVIYSTTEPCPMCFSAIHWAKIKSVVYGTAIADVARRGFNEFEISNKELRKLGKSKIAIRSKFMLPECKALLNSWDNLTDKRTY